MNIFFISSIKIYRGRSAGSSRLMNYAKGLSENHKVYLISAEESIKFGSYEEVFPNILVAVNKSDMPENHSVFLKIIGKIMYPVTVFLFFYRITIEISAKKESVILFYPSTQVFFDYLSFMFFKLFRRKKVLYELNEMRSKNLKDFIYAKSINLRIRQRIKNFLQSIKFFISESLFKYYDGMIAISYSIEKELKKKNINTIRIPILAEPVKSDYSEKNYLQSDAKLNLGYFGMISNQKEDFHTILNALSKIKKDGYDFHFNLYGSIDSITKESIFLKLADKLNLSDNISCFPSISHDQVLEKMKRNHILLSIRRKSNQSNFSFSTKLAEYMSSGVPVLVSDVGDNVNFVEDGFNGFIAKSGDDSDLAEKIKYIYKNYSSIVSKIRENAFKTVNKHFNIEMYLKDFEKFLKGENSSCKEKSSLEIAICTLANFPEGMAVSNRVYYHAKGLKDNGQNVKIFIVKPTEFPTNIVNSDIKGEIEGIPFEYTPGKTTRSLYFLQRRYDDITGPIIAALKIIKGNYDAAILISSNSFYHVTILKILFKIFGVIFIVERTELPFHNKKSYGLYKYKNKLYNRFIYKNLDGFLAISKYLVDHYSTIVSKKCPVLLIPVLIDEAEIYNKDIKRTNNIVYTGPLLQHKDGILTIIEAFAIVENNYPESKLILTGNLEKSTDRNEIIRIIMEKDISAKVVFAGFMSRSEMIELLNSASALVLAKPSSKQADACFPTKLGEYLSSGNPIVVTRTGEIPLYLKDGENAFIAEPDSVESFSLKLEEVLSDPVYSRKVGENGRRTAIDKFSYKKNTAKVIDLIFKIRFNRGKNDKKITKNF